MQFLITICIKLCFIHFNMTISGASVLFSGLKLGVLLRKFRMLCFFHFVIWGLNFTAVIRAYWYGVLSS